MKTNIFNITALALMISTSFIAGKSTIDNSFDLTSENLTELAELNTNCYTMVEAKVIDGEVIPFVTLPELTIEGSYNDETMVTAKVVDGQILPFVQLPVLTINAQ